MQLVFFAALDDLQHVARKQRGAAAAAEGNSQQVDDVANGEPLITLVGIAVLPICSVPPALVNVMAPDTTAPGPRSRVPPLILVAIVVPPEAMSSTPPLSILVLVTFALPPMKATFWCPPLPTTVLIAVPVPPKPTNWVPLRIVVLIAEPTPKSPTNCAPPEIVVANAIPTPGAPPKKPPPSPTI